jgi:hypothetical protein
MRRLTPYEILLSIAVPRPNGSEACERTADFIADRMAELTPGVTVQEFFLRPYMPAMVGLFMLVAAVACVLLVLRRRPWIALLIALLIPAVYLLEFEVNVPVVSRIAGRTGTNIIADFLPGGPIEEYITFSAHFDSKTELLDHQQRKPVHNFAPVAMVCLIVASVLGIVAGARERRSFRGRHPRLSAPRSSRSRLYSPRARHSGADARAVIRARRIAVLLGIVGVAGLFMLTFVFAGGLFMPIEKQSPGARDDGSAVALLLSMADKLARGSAASGGPALEHTAVRLVFFGGEEVNMQGSTAYASSEIAKAGGFNKGIVVNCELLGGDEPYAYWESSGTFLSKFPSSEKAIELYQSALSSLGLAPAVAAGSIFDDSGPMLAAGFQAVTVGNSDPERPDSYHNAGDGVGNVRPERLNEFERVLFAMASALDGRGR